VENFEKLIFTSRDIRAYSNSHLLVLKLNSLYLFFSDGEIEQWTVMKFAIV